jgi:hypothetical protein
MLLAPVGGGVAHVLGPAPVETCATACSDDDEQGQCAPTCADCTCCSHVRPLAVATPRPGLLAPLLRASRLSAETQEPSSADADDILHVPIAPLA